jgi:glycosyltransferase involved in cell wall biosynthesis
LKKSTINSNTFEAKNTKPALQMKLLFVIPSITNYFTFLEGLIDTLKDRGHKVHLATSRKHIARISAYRREIRCEVHDIDFPRALAPIRHYRAGKKVKDLVHKINPDIVNVHFSAALFTAMIGKDGSWPPTTGTIHGLGSPLISGWRKAIIARAEKWSTNRADEVYVLTSDDRDYLSKMAPNAKVNVLDSFGIGCDLNRFNPKNIDRKKADTLKAELGIEQRDFVYVFIGRQTHFKGFDKVVKAFLKTREKHKNSKLLLVGEKDRIHPTSLRPQFEKALQTDPSIIRVGWRENVQDYLAISDLNVFPSEREGMPVNLMESLAMGVPVLTINSRGCRDVVRQNIDGRVLDDRSINALSIEMNELQENSSLLEKYAQNAVEGSGRFDREHFLEAQFGIFERLAG